MTASRLHRKNAQAEPTAADIARVTATSFAVTPDLDEDVIFRRRASSGNQQTVALSLGLDPNELCGRDSNGSSNMLAAIRESPIPTATIGISSAEIVDPNRDVLKALAYRHYE